MRLGVFPSCHSGFWMWGKVDLPRESGWGAVSRAALNPWIQGNKSSTGPLRQASLMENGEMQGRLVPLIRQPQLAGLQEKASQVTEENRVLQDE